MKKKDIIIIAVVLILIVQAILINKFINSGKAATVQVFVGDKLYRELPLNKDTTLEVNENNGKNTIKIHDNGVEMTFADCPDKVCVKTGYINKPGQSIVCLPHKVNVKIISDEENSGTDVNVN